MRLAFLFWICGTSLFCQKNIDLSFEFQAYPTGLIPGVRIELPNTDNSVFLLRLGYNWFRHRDLGVHDDERGGGPGFTIGYKNYFRKERQGWHYALKSDFWWNRVDWFDVDLMDNIIEGETSITVIQPTAEIGYTLLKNESFVFTPTITFGYEWNVRTSGEPTGQGVIVLIGIQIGKRF